MFCFGRKYCIFDRGDLGTAIEVMTRALALFTNMASWVPSLAADALTKFMAIVS